MQEKNSTPLQAVWSQITTLLDSGFSLIPVRDKAEAGKPIKSPYPYWKKYQSEIISPAELWEQMERFNTSAIAVICGKVSGNLEVIDIDVKWKPGIDAKLFSDIRLLYPNIWDRLRLHRTPSGGFHILYKIIDQIPPGSQKLASRISLPTDNVKTKNLSFIETKGEGGYVLIPPSLSYSIYKAEPIPLLTWTERCALISLCNGYNEIIKIQPQPKGNKYENDYYDENPFEHYNRSEQGAQALIDLGWKANGENSTFAWFTKPGSNSKERHAAYIKDKQLFFFWSTTTEFENNRCYHPATIIAISKFGGDHKKTYRDLVDRGFGKIRHGREMQMVKRAKELPANISEEAKTAHTEIVDQRNESHPYGVFWQVSEDGLRIQIDREGVYKVSKEIGFRLYRGELFLLVGRILRRVEGREFQDKLKAYIREKDPDLNLNILNTWEHFLQVAGTFTMTRICELRDDEILRDTRTQCYKFYEDCYICITRDGYTIHDYVDLDKIIFESKLLKRKFNIDETGCFIDFLNKALEYEERKKYVDLILGYLAHDYKNSAIGYIILMSEQVENPKMGGGSGKNLLCDLLKHIITKTGKAGSQVKYDEKFLQVWNRERIFVISDAPKNFDFAYLKELSTGHGTWKKLFKDEQTISPEDMPKFVIQTNFSYSDMDGGIKRRVLPLEFTEFFTRSRGVDVYYKKFFPDDWNEDDWAGYDYSMINGIKEWLRSDLKIENIGLTDTGWRKQFTQKYPNVLDFIENFIGQWLDDVEVNNEVFGRQQHEFLKEQNISETRWPGVRKLNDGIREYCDKHKIHYEVNVPRGIYKCRVFMKEEKPPF